ncbi:2-oxoacid ferredoxin oxidoreductase subunit beta [Fervidicella metallireducens AeB]|uniref:2-oxoacid ferredoxin oxidoreductase subunit beta n=2 Tax=Fervidicella TaxID=1403538 RepID=A0A017RUE7_9CLOT|nr:2-oxoacid ferredoxin oxidoreductase subunit beta [Fervidicella metallireducens AeB]
MNREMIEKYFRKEQLPHIWCPGCGNGIALAAIVDAIDSSDLDKEKICIVSGIGCSSRASGYLNFDSIHTTHGRAIAFATGVKMANPEMNVIVITGDGDCTAIGGNHLIHACRRNIDLNVIVFNNNIYGMTGGQYSPTTPKSAKTATSRHGTVERQFDICDLSRSAGATYVARSTVYHYRHLTDMIKGAFKNKGFSIVEALTPCPVQYGRRNKLGNPPDIMKELKESVSLTDSSKIKIGVFKNESEPEYTSEYHKLVEAEVGKYE